MAKRNDQTTQEMRVVQGRGFCVRVMTLSRATTFAQHAHRGGHVVLVYEGEWTEHNGSRHRLRRGDILVHPGPIEHETHAAAGTTVAVIDLSEVVLAELAEVLGNRLRTIHITFRDVEGIPERIRAEISHADEAAALVVYSLVLQILAVGTRVSMAPARRKPEWMSRVTAYIHENLGERLTVDRLASVAAVSESHLSHSFARHLDCSVSDYIRDARLRAAARALRQTHDSIQQIAWQFGFSDQAHFTRTFKSAYGVTPTEYRSSRTAWDEGLWMERKGRKP